jgi:hypothetical protein
MSALAIFKRWPITSSLFVLHAAFVALIYVWWASSTDVDRGMIWMTVFLLDLPSSYLFFHRPGSMGLYAISAVFIGGLQWALFGLLLDWLRKLYKRRQQQ